MEGLEPVCEIEICTVVLIQFMESLGHVRLRSVHVVIIQFMEGLGPACETEDCTVVLIQFMEGLGPVRLRSVLLSYSYGGPGACETEVCTVVIQLWRAWGL